MTRIKGKDNRSPSDGGRYRDETDSKRHYYNTERKRTDLRNGDRRNNWRRSRSRSRSASRSRSRLRYRSRSCRRYSRYRSWSRYGRKSRRRRRSSSYRYGGHRSRDRRRHDYSRDRDDSRRERRRRRRREEERRKKKHRKPLKSGDIDDSVGHYEGQAGDYIDDRYKVVRDAGLGTFGRVLECWDTKEKRVVAMKVIRRIKKYTESAKIEADILEEVNQKDTQGNSLCVKLFDRFEYKGHMCLAFEKLGTSLYEYMKSHDYKPFSIACIRDMAYQMLHSLAYIHGIALIHTDLKPENVLFVDDEQITLTRSGKPKNEAHVAILKSRGVEVKRQKCMNGQRSDRSSSRSSVDELEPDRDGNGCQGSGRISDRQRCDVDLEEPVGRGDIEDSEWSFIDSSTGRPVQPPTVSNKIKLIDFGGATFEDEHKSSLINTRQYRAPEVILGLGWSYPSDIWSIGCVIAELYIGDLLFSTHNNLEHLALIERCKGSLPREMVEKASRDTSKYFDSKLHLRFPKDSTPRESIDHVAKMKELKDIILPGDKDTGLLDLLEKLLQVRPGDRITAKEALSHPFFANCEMKKALT